MCFDGSLFLFFQLTLTLVTHSLLYINFLTNFRLFINGFSGFNVNTNG